MNKQELISTMSNSNNLSQKDNEAALNAFVDIVGKELGKGGRIQLVGFGTFEVSKREARKGRNPATGEEITIPKAVIPKMKFSKALKDSIN